VNIFEGARRVATVFAGLIAVGSAIAIYDINPDVVLKYRVMYFGAEPLRLDICDDSVDAKRYRTFNTESGREFSIQTCFKASKANNGKFLIPYAAGPDDTVYLNSEYSDAVRDYTEAVSNEITPTASDLEEAEQEYVRQSWLSRLKGIAWLIGGLMAYWMVVRIIGWVVRGFLGIQNGQDYRIAPIGARNN
jgi:hypothetical protein